jgi:uncharacterized protein (TIGR03086 family)
MTTIDTLRDCLDLEQTVLDVGPVTDDRAAPTPCSAFDTGQLVDHVLSTHRFLIAALGGDPPPTDGDAAELHRALADAALAAWTARGTDGEIELGGNVLPAPFVLSLHVLEAYIHAWDLAVALGRPFGPADELTGRVWEAARLVITDDVRSDAPGAPYRAVHAVGDDESPVARLIAHSGRDPHWAAASVVG